MKTSTVSVDLGICPSRSSAPTIARPCGSQNQVRDDAQAILSMLAAQGETMNNDNFAMRAAILKKYYLDSLEKYERLVQRTSEILVLDRLSAVEFLYQVLPSGVR